MYQIEVNFVLSKNNSQNFLIAVCNSSAKIIASHHFSNGFNSSNKWEFFVKLEFLLKTDYQKFIESFDGNYTISEDAGGNI